MTPGARVAAAITILNQILTGVPAEQALTGWARSSRFAGSKDRAAIRDHVFDVLRAKRSLGEGDGRSLMIALMRRDGHDLAALFNGVGHAPPALADDECDAPVPLDTPAACDVPDWLWPAWQASLGDKSKAVALVQQTRASVFLRVNLNRASRADAARLLAADDIDAAPVAGVDTALRVRSNPRRIKLSQAYVDGFVELQDASSQWAIGRVPVKPGARVLDYCAGGGGKALAFADAYDAQIFAHDINAKRMADIPARAARAGAKVEILTTDALQDADHFDVVFCDAPCSGSGTWRRTPDAKWRLTEDDLDHLGQMQKEALAAAAALTCTSGFLAYATCSVLCKENEDIVNAFIDNDGSWKIVSQEKRLPDADGDGFFICVLQTKKTT